jgi:uncharacterized protein DUF1566
MLRAMTVLVIFCIGEGCSLSELDRFYLAPDAGPCGKPDQRCCPGASCESGAVCNGETCAACGAPSQPCCTGQLCDFGSHCTPGGCASGSPDGGPCTPNPNACTNKSCGYVSNGCGQELCGRCTAPTLCGGGGIANQCGGDEAWALWPMPDSPTIYCSDGVQSVPCPTGRGQDGDLSINLPQYDVTADTVTDPITGLMWERNVTLTSPTLSWMQAQQRCGQLSLAGFLDWRLPSRIELLSLDDLGRFAPALSPNAFPMDTPTGDFFWTSSSYAPDTTQAWSVNFAGWPLPRSASMLFRVRCVRNR